MILELLTWHSNLPASLNPFQGSLLIIAESQSAAGENKHSFICMSRFVNEPLQPGLWVRAQWDLWGGTGLSRIVFSEMMCKPPFFGILISVAGPHGGKRVHCSCLTAGRSTIFCFEPFMYSRSVGGFFFEYSWFPSRHAGLGKCFTWNWAEVWMWVWMVVCLCTSPSDGLVNPVLPSPAGTVSQIIKTNGFDHFEIHLPQFNC